MSETEFKLLLKQLIAGVPYMVALGVELDSQSEDGVTLRLPFRDALIGDTDKGILAGGVVTALLDHVCGMAVWSALNRFTSIATLDLRIDYMRAARTGQDLFARAHCYRTTQSVGFVRAVAYDSTPDDPVATAQSAFMLNSDGKRKPGANLDGQPVRGDRL